MKLRKPKELKLIMQEVWTQTKALCKPPHLKYTALTCAIQFGLTARQANENLILFQSLIILL